MTWALVFLVVVVFIVAALVVVVDAVLDRRRPVQALFAAVLAALALWIAVAMVRESMREERRQVEACLASGGFPVEGFTDIDCLEVPPR